MPTTYILYSKDLDKYYIGYTKGLMSDRLTKHLQSRSGFTSHAKDWQVVYEEEYATSTEASRRERELKGWKSRKRIERLISKD